MGCCFSSENEDPVAPSKATAPPSMYLPKPPPQTMYYYMPQQQQQQNFYQPQATAPYSSQMPPMPSAPYNAQVSGPPYAYTMPLQIPNAVWLPAQGQRQVQTQSYPTTTYYSPSRNPTAPV